MPFRLDPEKYPNRTKIQFTTSARMPYDIYQACLATGAVSNTAYVQDAVCEALSRDLGIPLDELKAALPPRRGLTAVVLDPAEQRMVRNVSTKQHGGVVRIGPANTIEEVI